MSQNPYETPSAELETPSSSGETTLLTQPRSNGIGSGWSWIADGFQYFKKSPGPWIGAVVVFFIILIALSIIPLIGQLAMSLTLYIWVAGFMIGCREQDRGNAFQFKHLFAGFSNNTGNLVILSLIVFVISIIIMFLAIGQLYFSMLTGDPQAAEQMMSAPGTFLLPFLIAMLVMIPLIMAVFFAPILIVLHDKPVIESMKMSFMGCLKNILPFLLYSVVAIIIYILGALPLLLGLLVVFPVLIASVYVSYKAIFLQ